MSMLEKEKYSTTLRVGDVATAMYRPASRDPKPKLFEFMGLQPGYGIVRTNQNKDGSQWLENFMAISCLLAMFLFLLLMVYSLKRFSPIETAKWDWVFAVLGGIFLGGGMFGALQYSSWRLNQLRASSNEDAIKRNEPIEIPSRRSLSSQFILLLGTLLLGATSGWAIGFSLNAVCDRSVPKLEPIEIVSVDERRASVVYCFAKETGRGDHEFKIDVPLQKLKLLKEKGSAEAKSGAFGWDWVKTIHPGKEKPVG